MGSLLVCCDEVSLCKHVAQTFDVITVTNVSHVSIFLLQSSSLDTYAKNVLTWVWKCVLMKQELIYM